MCKSLAFAMQSFCKCKTRKTKKENEFSLPRRDRKIRSLFLFASVFWLSPMLFHSLCLRKCKTSSCKVQQVFIKNFTCTDLSTISFCKRSFALHHLSRDLNPLYKPHSSTVLPQFYLCIRTHFFCLGHGPLNRCIL